MSPGNNVWNHLLRWSRSLGKKADGACQFLYQIGNGAESEVFGHKNVEYPLEKPFQGAKPFHGFVQLYSIKWFYAWAFNNLCLFFSNLLRPLLFSNGHLITSGESSFSSFGLLLSFRFVCGSF